MKSIVLRPFLALKLLTFIGLALTGACHFPGLQGDGRIVQETRDITDFSTVETGGVFTVDWVPGAPSLTITTDQNLLRHVTTTSTGRKLRIEWDTQLRPTNGIKIRLSSPALTGVQLNGAARFNARQLSGNSFAVEGNGATRIDLEGNVSGLSAELNGASRLEAEYLKTQTCELAISGAGRAEVSPSESLRVAISGAGKVTYAGNPKNIEKNITGAGSVKRRD